jgi:hypothetical protein
MPKGETSRPYTSKERKSPVPLAHTLGKALTRKASAAGTPDPMDARMDLPRSKKIIPQPEVTAAKRRKRERGF